ncbi:MAG TPA: PDZ domain-containing protein [Oscillatoriaceae cyanobacterium]
MPRCFTALNRICAIGAGITILFSATIASAFPGDDPIKFLAYETQRGWVCTLESPLSPGNDYDFDAQKDWIPIDGRRCEQSEGFGIGLDANGLVDRQRLHYSADWGYLHGDFAAANEGWVRLIHKVFPDSVAHEILTKTPVVNRFVPTNVLGEPVFHNFRLVPGSNCVYLFEASMPFKDSSFTALDPNGTVQFQLTRSPILAVPEILESLHDYTSDVPKKDVPGLFLGVKQYWNQVLGREVANTVALSSSGPQQFLRTPPPNAIAVAQSYAGIGVQIERTRKHLWVTGIIEKGPAWGAGMRTWDEIVAIDGKPCAAMTVRQATDAIRGPSGTYVALTVSRGQFKPKVVEVMRRPIQLAY